MQRCNLAIRMLYNIQAGWPQPETSPEPTTEADKTIPNYQLKAIEKNLGQNKFQKSYYKKR